MLGPAVKPITPPTTKPTGPPTSAPDRGPNAASPTRSCALATVGPKAIALASTAAATSALIVVLRSGVSLTRTLTRVRLNGSCGLRRPDRYGCQCVNSAPCVG